ncbi:MAG: DUF3187 family protein [Deltaproteobacteria bacterium]|nr:DUF3187 family protein [Deltaproteobacteria bacterium]
MLFGPTPANFFLNVRRLIVLSLFLVSRPIFAESFYPVVGPIPIRNQNPLYLQSLDLRPERPVVLPSGSYEVEMAAPYSNIFERRTSTTSGYQLALDMELLRNSFLFHYGFLDQFEVGLELPFLHFDGGFLDSFVQGFHNAFGFPNGGREDFPNDSFDYTIRKNGTTVYQVKEQGYGLSDLVLDFKYQLLEEQKKIPALATAFYLKLPTGDRSLGLGSGNTDLGFQLSAEKSYDRFHGMVNLGYFLIGGNDLLVEINNSNLFAWMAGLEVSLIRDIWSGMIQLSGSSSLFHGTGFPELDDPVLNLTIGFSGKIGDQQQWTIAFQEDPVADDAAIDFTAWFQWCTKWGGPKKIRGLLLGKAL